MDPKKNGPQWWPDTQTHGDRHYHHQSCVTSRIIRTAAVKCQFGFFNSDHCLKYDVYTGYPSAYSELTLGGLLNSGPDPVCTRFEIPKPAADVEQLIRVQ